MGFLLSVLGFLKSIPAKAWGIIAIIAALFIAVSVWNGHERAIGRQQDQATITGLQAQILALQAANASGVDAVHNLQKSLADCEKGRIADAKLTADAKDAYDAQLKVLVGKAQDAHAHTAQLLAGDCKVWAGQAACGVTP